jgi:hypothetical protein
MKRWWLAAALSAIAIPSTAVAQAAVGLRGGARWSQISTSQDGGSVSGMVVGGYLGFGLSNRLALQFEAIYGTRGGDALRLGTDDLSNGASPVTVKMKYIEIPILLRTGFPGRRFLPSFFVGPYVGVLLDCSLAPDGEDSRSCDEGEATQRFSPRATDYGITMGAALDMALGESTVFVDARYSLGLLSLQSGSDPFDARHTGFSLSGGFAVPLGR